MTESFCCFESIQLGHFQATSLAKGIFSSLFVHVFESTSEATSSCPNELSRSQKLLYPNTRSVRLTLGESRKSVILEFH